MNFFVSARVCVCVHPHPRKKQNKLQQTNRQTSTHKHSYSKQFRDIQKHWIMMKMMAELMTMMQTHTQKLQKITIEILQKLLQKSKFEFKMKS